MTENIKLKIVEKIDVDGDGITLEDVINEALKGKNVLATQVLDGKVWIWYKTTPDNGYDGFSVTE